MSALVPRLHARHAWLPGGWARNVAITIGAGGDIASVSIGEEAASDALSVEVLLPGIGNLHSHAFQRAMAGLTEVAGPEPDTFWSWRKLMYAFVAELTPDDLGAIASQLYAEMLRHGYTAVAEFHYLHHAPDGSRYTEITEMSTRCIAAAREAGIAITHLPVLYAHGGFGGAAPGEAQRRFVNDPDTLLAMIATLHDAHAGDPDVRIGAAAHSLRAVTAAELGELAAGVHIADAAAPLHIHIAEQTQEVQDCLEWSGARPVQWLLDHQAVDARWCLVHATHVSGEEVKGMAATQCVVGLCPSTEANLGDGLFPAGEYRRHGGRFGVGSDSHVGVSPVEELRWLEYGQRLLYRRRNLLADGPGQGTGASLYRAALTGGAQALARRHGRIEPGMRADLVALDASHPAVCHREGDRVLDAWVFAGNDTPVRDVLVGGRHVIRDGLHPRAEAIAERFHQSMRRLLALA